MKAILLFLLLLAPAALAAPVAVTSGEHPGFTRLVFDFGAPQDWQLGRTADGYALRMAGATQYDLSDVYRLIPRDRLAAIWVEPGSGDLRLGVGCACHALPFLFRPGVLVVDLRDGPPSQASVFETAISGAPLPELTRQAPPRPRQRPDQPMWPVVPVAKPVDLPALDEPALTGLRDALLEQLSRGAARGVVDVVADLPAAVPHEPPAQMRIGPEPGYDAAPQDRAEGLMTGTGAACLTDAQLDIGTWGGEGAAAAQFAPASAGLLGEFDAPDAGAVSRAVRQMLYFGFGAEARHLLRSFAVAETDRALWDSMAQILDDGHGAEAPFAGMAPCDTAAALWAQLAAPTRRSGGNNAAVLRSFSGLPPHLRRHLGPMLAERLLKGGQAEAARAVRDAILRGGAQDDPVVRRVSAEVDLVQGNTAKAEATLQVLASEPGPHSAEATLAWAERLLADGKAVDAALVTTLAALAQEHGGTLLASDLRRVHLLATAAAGDFEAAFALRNEAPEAEAELWARLAADAPDSALLSLAIVPAGGAAPNLPPATRIALATRLTELGLPDAALSWLSLGAAASADERFLAARAEVVRRDGRASLRYLAGLTGEEADLLRAEAALLLGDSAAAAAAYAALGDAEGGTRSAIAAQDWAQLASGGPEPWRGAASLLAPAPAPENTGALARAAGLVTESAAARAQLSEFLMAVPPATLDP